MLKNKFFFAPSDRSLLWVISLSFFLWFILTLATWEMNPWPSDTETYYFEVALKVPKLPYVAAMHYVIDEERVRWLHGKEIYILLAARMQQLLNDFTTLRPFLAICILSIIGSAILIFLIARFYWGRVVGGILYSLFVTSFWPYIYVLFTKHQPLGLVFFLLSIYLLQKIRTVKRKQLLNFFSGAAICASLFSSSTSSLYLPLYLTCFLYHQFFILKNGTKKEKVIKSIGKAFGVVCLGVLTVYSYVNFPHLIANLKYYWEYVQISGKYNHFFYNQRVLEQWFPAHELKTRGGWLWIIRYFCLIMPVVLPLFFASIIYLCSMSRKKRGLRPIFGILTLIVLSWSAPILAEIRQVAQYGANYFPSFLGILMLMGVAIYVLLTHQWNQLSVKLKRIIIGAGVFLGFLQVVVNGYWFLTDIYPTRMVTTILSKKIERLNVRRIYTYRRHPYRKNLVDNLSPSLFKKVEVVHFDFLPKVTDGYVLIPPITGDAIYNAATSFYTDFDEDIYLNELRRKGNFKDYVVTSYKTLASSQIWPHEEEVLSYRYLILGQWSKDFIEEGRVWLLDGKKLFRDIDKNIPSRDYIFLYQRNVTNIGTKKRVYVFKGYEGYIKNPIEVSHLVFRMYKVGHPTDQLIARVYKVDQKQLVWVPISENFQSLSLEGKTLTDDPQGRFGIFEFPKPIKFSSGACFVTIYRTGPLDDENYYRIYGTFIGTLGVKRILELSLQQNKI